MAPSMAPIRYEEALELARMADVLLQPSKTEGFGIPKQPNPNPLSSP